MPEHIDNILRSHLPIFMVRYRCGGKQVWNITLQARDEARAIELVINAPGANGRKLVRCLRLLDSPEALDLLFKTQEEDYA